MAQAPCIGLYKPCTNLPFGDCAMNFYPQQILRRVMFHPSHSSSLGLERFFGNAGGGGKGAVGGGCAGAGRATRVGSRGSKTSNCAWEMLG